MKWNCTKLNTIFNISGIDTIDLELIPSKSGYAGELNGFHGKKHTESTKEILRQKTLKLCENDDFRMSRANYGPKNGRYGCDMSGEKNPMFGRKHSEETKRKISERARLRNMKK